jgi:predicted DNA binding CopG/RHH family protein
MNQKLDKYELDIEENFEQQISIVDPAFAKSLQQTAKNHLKDKKPITIRVSQHDIEAIKIKASKLGLAYQTYINMLIHKEATKYLD